MSDQGAPLKPFGRDELIAAVAGRRMSKRAAGRAIDVVLDEVLRQVTPVIEREWCGGEVVRRIRGLMDPSRKSIGTALAGQDLNERGKVVGE